MKLMSLMIGSSDAIVDDVVLLSTIEHLLPLFLIQLKDEVSILPLTLLTLPSNHSLPPLPWCYWVHMLQNGGGVWSSG